MSSTLTTVASTFPYPDLSRIKRSIEGLKKAPVPAYLFDPQLLIQNYKRLEGAFHAARLNPYIYYALKSNPYPGIVTALKEAGASFDVSSVHEFKIARKAGAKDFIFTGPGKTAEDLAHIIRGSRKNLFVHLESFQELYNLGFVTAELDEDVSCGVRVVPGSHTAWDKFGIPLKELRTFIEHACQFPNIHIRGIQFHISYAKNAKPYTDALKEVSEYLKKNFTEEERTMFSFIDIGGGFTPETAEGEYPWNKDGVLLFDEPGLVQKILKLPASKRAKKIEVETIEKIAADIAAAWNRHICPVITKAALFIEPGRFLSHNCMHLLMRVVDKKKKDTIIVNAGWNMVGWEKYQYLYYSPIFNLSRWDPKNEFPCLIYGNLCIPEDIWGYYMHGKKCEVGDLLLMPYQGAYTHTYRQEFIRGIPPVVHIS